jgi:hypothetical protein
MLYILFTTAFFISIINIIFYVKIKSIVKSKGYAVDIFWNHFRDAVYFIDIIKAEPSSEIKRKYLMMLIINLASVLLFFAIFLLIFINVDKLMTQ